MARETKVGLLIGVGAILLVAIIINDYLVTANQVDDGGPANDIASDSSMTNARPVRTSSLGRAVQTPPLRRMRTRRPRQSQYDAHSQARRISPLGRPGGQRRRASANSQPSAGSGRLANNPRQSQMPNQRRAARQRSASSNSATIPAPQTLQNAQQHPQPTQPRQPQSSEPPQSSTDLPPAVRLGSDQWNNAANDARSNKGESSASPANQQTQQPGASRSPDTSSIIHYVKDGQTLTELAQRYYGDPGYWKRIAAANPDQVGQAGRIVKGARLVIPNKAGLAQVPESNDTAEAEDEPGRADNSKTITVTSGDSLSDLARQHLGDATRWHALYEANRDRLDTENDLTVGMTLRLPSKAQNHQPSPDSHDQTKARTYTVRKNDTLYEIAAKTLGDGKRWREIVQANESLDSPDQIKPGKILRIPADE